MTASASETTSAISVGNMPPLVSQSAAISAPASIATRTTSSAYALLARYPSKKCSASRKTRRPSFTINAIVSRTIAKFSSSEVLSARSTWRSCDLATTVMIGACESKSARTCSSSAAFTLGRRVAPKATNCAFLNFNSLATRAKNSVSRGLAPGQPPSIKPTPRSSRCLAIVILSWTERFKPSCCAPSRNVVS